MSTLDSQGKLSGKAHSDQPLPAYGRPPCGDPSDLSSDSDPGLTVMAHWHPGPGAAAAGPGPSGSGWSTSLSTMAPVLPAGAAGTPSRRRAREHARWHAGTIMAARARPRRRRGGARDAELSDSEWERTQTGPAASWRPRVRGRGPTSNHDSDPTPNGICSRSQGRSRTVADSEVSEQLKGGLLWLQDLGLCICYIGLSAPITNWPNRIGAAIEFAPLSSLRFHLRRFSILLA